MVQQDFINPNFLLGNNTAYELYYRFAENKPIIDFACMINPEVLHNKSFLNINDLWIKDDPEKKKIIKNFNGTKKEKFTDSSIQNIFKDWAFAIQNCAGSSMYIHTHLELARIFNIYELLTEETSGNIFKNITEKLQQQKMKASDILESYNVEKIFLNTDPFTFSNKEIYSSKVVPSFDMTNLLQINDANNFVTYLKKVEEQLNTEISNFNQLCDVIKRQHTLFHSIGCKSMYLEIKSFNIKQKKNVDDADTCFRLLKNGKELDAYQINSYARPLISFLHDLNIEKGWKEIISNKTQNNNTLTDLFISEENQDIYKAPLINFKDSIPSEINYSQESNTNLHTYYIPDSIHYKTFDNILNTYSQKHYINAISGYTAGANNLLSFSRHEYFRRLLCNYIGDQVEKGFIPDDDDLLKNLIENIIYYNIKKHLNY